MSPETDSTATALPTAGDELAPISDQPAIARAPERAAVKEEDSRVVMLLLSSLITGESSESNEKVELSAEKKAKLAKTLVSNSKVRTPAIPVRQVAFGV
jgi:hypothetical protein